MEATNFAIAFTGGLVPALFWLWFWLREDKERPEPYGLIAIAFIAGMAVVPLALPLQKFALGLFEGETLIFIWVVIEEVLKYAIALIIVLWHKDVDEPIDLIIYMIVIALGFAALENSLFIFKPLVEGDLTNTLLTGKFRFLGATLLHVLASGTVGAMMAFSYYKNDVIKLIYGSLGLFIAVILHGLFNLYIMDATGAHAGETILFVFLFVWLGIIALFIVFEKIKYMEARYHRLHPQRQ